MRRPRVVLADDYEPLLDRLRTLFHDDFDVVAFARDGKAALEAVLEHKPDLVILDIAMPAMGGFEAARQIRVLLPEVKVLFFTNHSSPIYLREALRIGCAGLVSKVSLGQLLLHAAWQALRNDSRGKAEWEHAPDLASEKAAKIQPVLGVLPG